MSHRIAGRKWEAAWCKWKSMDFGINPSWLNFCPRAVQLEQVSLLLWTLQVLHFKNRVDNAYFPKSLWELNDSSHAILSHWGGVLWIPWAYYTLSSLRPLHPFLQCSFLGWLLTILNSQLKWYLFWVCFKITYVSPTSYSLLLYMFCFFIVLSQLILFFHCVFVSSCTRYEL